MARQGDATRAATFGPTLQMATIDPAKGTPGPVEDSPWAGRVIRVR